MKQKIILVTLILSFGLNAQTDPADPVTDKFFEVDQTLEELQTEMRELKKRIRETEIRNSAPVIRQEIKKMMAIPEMTHEILLANGTIVQGKIIFEDIEKLIVQTQIGQLTIPKKNIQLTRKAAAPKALCVTEGPIHEKTFATQRTYNGTIKNNGVRRADFPRIIFRLYDENATLIATDSVLVSGSYHMFASGIQTDATLKPGESAAFECTVLIPENAPVSYYIKELKWDEFDTSY